MDEMNGFRQGWRACGSPCRYTWFLRQLYYSIQRFLWMWWLLLKQYYLSHTKIVGITRIQITTVNKKYEDFCEQGLSSQFQTVILIAWEEEYYKVYICRIGKVSAQIEWGLCGSLQPWGGRAGFHRLARRRSWKRPTAVWFPGNTGRPGWDGAK